MTQNNRRFVLLERVIDGRTMDTNKIYINPNDILSIEECHGTSMWTVTTPTMAFTIPVRSVNKLIDLKVLEPPPGDELEHEMGVDGSFEE